MAFLLMQGVAAQLINPLRDIWMQHINRCKSTELLKQNPKNPKQSQMCVMQIPIRLQVRSKKFLNCCFCLAFAAFCCSFSLAIWASASASALAEGSTSFHLVKSSCAFSKSPRAEKAIARLYKAFAWLWLSLHDKSQLLPGVRHACSQCKSLSW